MRGQASARTRIRIGRISRNLRDSIQYALEHRREALEYALEFAGDMEGRLVDELVGMYVNQRTLDLVRRWTRVGERVSGARISGGPHSRETESRLLRVLRAACASP